MNAVGAESLLFSAFFHVVQCQFVIFFINSRHACAARVNVVGSVCVFVTQHLTSGTFVCLAIGTTYSTSSEGQNVCVVFSENAPMQN